jgi:hypothetical protein
LAYPLKSYNYQNQFWSQGTITPGNAPAPRWGASGGTNPLQPFQNTLTNTIVVAGGANGSTGFPFSQVWGLDITGSVASDSAVVSGTWHQYVVSAASSSGTPKVGQAGTVLGTGKVISYGGCDFMSGGVFGASCGTPDTYISGTDTQAFTAQWNTGANCPSGRYSPTLAPNLNPNSASFASQAFLLFGSSNTSIWSDPQNGTSSFGEVGVLNSDAGTWSLILPSKDPTYGVPSMREGVAAVSIPSSVSSSVNASDILVFGGVETSSGKFLNELWILRAYNGVITSTNGTWSGGSGKLQSGKSASGAGVTIQFLTQCSTQLETPPNSTTSAPPPSGSNSSNNAGDIGKFEFTVGPLHQLFSPLSIALILPAVLFARLVYAPVTSTEEHRQPGILVLSIILGVVAYALGVAGLAMSFATIARNATSAAKRSVAGDGGSTTLKTAHGRAGIVLFAVLYVLVPLYALILYFTKDKATIGEEKEAEKKMVVQDAAGEKKHGRPESQHGLLGGSGSAALTPVAALSRTSAETTIADHRPSSNEPTPDNANKAQPSRRSALPSISFKSMFIKKPAQQVRPTRGFEVVNRPQRRPRTTSGSGLGAPRSHHDTPINLNDLSWMERRRALTEASDLDYATSHGHGRRVSTMTQPISDSQSPIETDPEPLPPPGATRPKPTIPSLPTSLFHITLHIIILFACVLCLVALFNRGPRAGFAVLFFWTVIFYSGMVILAWNGRPRESILTVIVSRLRAVDHHPPVRPPLNSDPNSGSTTVGGSSAPPGSGSSNGPYTHHQPPYRRVAQDDEIMSSRNPRSLESGADEAYDDGDEDDDERQWRMEQEMGRRDVSMIVTVPKRRLVIANE